MHFDTYESTKVQTSVVQAAVSPDYSNCEGV
jgi:hypothetical protein